MEAVLQEEEDIVWVGGGEDIGWAGATEGNLTDTRPCAVSLEGNVLTTEQAFRKVLAVYWVLI